MAIIDTFLILLYLLSEECQEKTSCRENLDNWFLSTGVDGDVFCLEVFVQIGRSVCPPILRENADRILYPKRHMQTVQRRIDTFVDGLAAHLNFRVVVAIALTDEMLIGYPLSKPVQGVGLLTVSMKRKHTLTVPPLSEWASVPLQRGNTHSTDCELLR